MESKNMGAIGGAIALLAVIGGGVWIWMLSNKFDSNQAVDSSFKLIEIETVKSDAENILAGLEQTSDIPIPTPNEKMGKTNPFVQN